MKWLLRIVLIVGAVVVAGAVVVPMLFRCVVAGTPIATPAGPRPVESLQPGDAVWTQGPHGPEEGRVVAVHASWAVRHHVLQLSDGRRLGVTGSHPIAADGGWVPAAQIGAGRLVATWEGSARVEAVATQLGLVDVYDLTVEPNHSFFAGGVLTHNKTAPGSANESRAISSLREMISAQVAFSSSYLLFAMPSCLKAPGSCVPGTAVDAPTFLDPETPWEGVRAGYVFSFHPGPLVDPQRRGTPQTPAVAFERWAALAVPSEPGVTGHRSFCADSTGLICFTSGGAPPQIGEAGCTACTDLN